MAVDCGMNGKDLTVSLSVESLLTDLELFFGEPRRTEILHAQDSFHGGKYQVFVRVSGFCNEGREVEKTPPVLRQKFVESRLAFKNELL
jgi:hypothetical protein